MRRKSEAWGICSYSVLVANGHYGILKNRDYFCVMQCETEHKAAYEL